MTRALVLNAGSSSLKFALYGDWTTEILRGAVSNLGPEARLTWRNGDRRGEERVAAPDHRAAVHAARRVVEDDGADPDVIVHRIVHGGTQYTEPVKLTAKVLADLEALAILAPLHGPAARLAIVAADIAFGPAAQVAVFDTALFRSLPPAAREYGIPERWRAGFGVRRYGFHGFAHECLRNAALAASGDPDSARIITVQLGRGCSVAAFRGAQPVATSMGFSPLDGLVMPARSGSLDAAAALYVVSRLELEPAEVLRILNEESGLVALSGGISNPAKIARKADLGDPACKLALDVFSHSLHQYLGGYAALLGGLDVIAMGGGISEHVPEFRRCVLDGVAWLGCEPAAAAVDPAEAASVVLSRPTSRVTALLVRVDEERLMAAQVRRHLEEAGAAPW